MKLQRVLMLNGASIIFCEVVAIYGVVRVLLTGFLLLLRTHRNAQIIGIVYSAKLDSIPETALYTRDNYFTGMALS